MMQVQRVVRSKLTPIVKLPRRVLYYADNNIVNIAEHYAISGTEIQWIVPNRRFRMELVGGSVVFSGSPFFDKTLVAVMILMPIDDSESGNGSSPIAG